MRDRTRVDRVAEGSHPLSVQRIEGHLVGVARSHVDQAVPHGHQGSLAQGTRAGGPAPGVPVEVPLLALEIPQLEQAAVGTLHDDRDDGARGAVSAPFGNRGPPVHEDHRPPVVTGEDMGLQVLDPLRRQARQVHDAGVGRARSPHLEKGPLRVGDEEGVSAAPGHPDHVDELPGTLTRTPGAAQELSVRIEIAELSRHPVGHHHRARAQTCRADHLTEDLILRSQDGPDREGWLGAQSPGSGALPGGDGSRLDEKQPEQRDHSLPRRHEDCQSCST